MSTPRLDERAVRFMAYLRQFRNDRGALANLRGALSDARRQRAWPLLGTSSSGRPFPVVTASRATSSPAWTGKSARAAFACCFSRRSLPRVRRTGRATPMPGRRARSRPRFSRTATTVSSFAPTPPSVTTSAVNACRCARTRNFGRGWHAKPKRRGSRWRRTRSASSRKAASGSPSQGTRGSIMRSSSRGCWR